MIPQSVLRAFGRIVFVIYMKPPMTVVLFVWRGVIPSKVKVTVSGAGSILAWAVNTSSPSGTPRGKKEI
jgi:hypothetical protein